MNRSLSEIDPEFVNELTERFTMNSNLTVWQAAFGITTSVGFAVDSHLYLIDIYGNVNGIGSVQPYNLPESTLFNSLREQRRLLLATMIGKLLSGMLMKHQKTYRRFSIIIQKDNCC